MTTPEYQGVRPRTRRGRPRRLGRLGRLLSARTLHPALLMGALLVLAVATDWKFRTRSADLAASGVIDLQILVEIGIWALIGSWIAWRLGLRDLGASRRRKRAEQGLPREPELRLLVLVGAVILVGSLYAPAQLALVRALQWAVLIAWVLLAARSIGADRDSLVACWVWLRRLLWGSALVATALSFVLSFDGLRSAQGDVWRYRWFTMHPIQTANGLGLAVLALTATYLAVPDDMFSSPRGRMLRRVLLAVFSGLLVLTRARGALAATLLGLLTLAVLCPSPRKRALTLMGALAGLALAGVGAEAITQLVLREQTVQQLQDFSGRGDIFRFAVQLFSERPLFGYGYLAGRQLFTDLLVWSPGESHNVIVEIALSFGLVGLLAFGALLATTGTRILRGLRARDFLSRLLMRESAALMVFILASGMVAEGFISPGYEAAVLVWTVAACVCTSRLQRLSVPSRGAALSV